MLAKTYTYGITGLDAYPVCIEVDVSSGLPSTVIVGLPDNAIRESRERVRSAIKNSGYTFAPQRITVNLSPADTKKEGPSFDLAIALGILSASKEIHCSHLQDYVLLGELSLDGHIQPISGALSMAMSIPRDRFKGVILPASNANEAAIVENIKVYPVKTLKEVIHLLKDPESIEPIPHNTSQAASTITPSDMDFADVKGQIQVKRGLEVAAAGGHNVLLIGPPGSGKTMLAKRMSTILPDMTFQESLETTKIHSVMGVEKFQAGVLRDRPFRSPHHTASDISLVGGGSIPKPGEVTLSHNGVLFLDELPEFNRNVLEALRQPLEDHYVTVARASKTLQFPAQFMLVASMNPCPCGWYTEPKKECTCTSIQIQRYMSKISGPILDRIDIHLEVPSLKTGELLSSPQNESSKQIKARTMAARKIQQERLPHIFTNAQMNHRQVKQYCTLCDEGRDLLKMAIEELGLSARAHDKILKISRTIADLANEQDILPDHISEAIQYRSLDRSW